MSLAFQAFGISLRRCRDLAAISEYLRAQAPLPETADDILRAALVQAVSALDRYVHERVRAGMLAAARSEMPRTDKFAAFALPLSGALRGSESNAPVDAWLGPLIVEQHSILTFQRADKVADAFRLVCSIENGLWPSVAGALGGADTKRTKEQLDLIVDRRNAIAHEDDSDGSGSRAPIDLPLVEASLQFLEDVVAAIDRIVPSQV